LAVWCASCGGHAFKCATVKLNTKQTFYIIKQPTPQQPNKQLRKDLDLVVNLVHGFSIPGIKTRHDDLDIVVIRENLEGEYSGLEHEVVDGVVESLKVRGRGGWWVIG
jgi:isocitrate/isopropylmalate dehydrogenase